MLPGMRWGIARYIRSALAFSYRSCQVLLAWSSRGGVASLDFSENLEAVHGHVARSLDAELNLVAVYAHNQNANVATNHN